MCVCTLDNNADLKYLLHKDIYKITGVGVCEITMADVKENVEAGSKLADKHNTGKQTPK